MTTVQGIDPNGIPRVFGEHSSFDIAETWAREEAAVYVQRRPDTGPLDRWTFETRGAYSV